METTVTLDRPSACELRGLLRAVGWGEHSTDALAESIAAYTATVCARDEGGALIGYASVFSDRRFTTKLGEFVVHPDCQRRGVGAAMMKTIEATFGQAPIYIDAMGRAASFFEAIGFRTSSTPVTAMFKRPG